MGGAVCFDKGSNGFFKQGSFKNNVATVSGGAVFEDQNVCVTYIETNFATNKAANGGAIAVSTGSSADVQYSLFDTDSATVSETRLSLALFSDARLTIPCKRPKFLDS
jgi:hypothetical protein